MVRSPDYPTAISKTVFTVCGHTLRCYVLADGTRVIHEDDYEPFVELIDTQPPMAVHDWEALQLVARWPQGSTH
jgi:hypothetical protein